MTTYTITDASPGTVISATPGVLASIVIAARPSQGWEMPQFDPARNLPRVGYLCLVDPSAPLRPRMLFNAIADDIGILAMNDRSGASTGMSISNGPIPFNQLLYQRLCGLTHRGIPESRA